MNRLVMSLVLLCSACFPDSPGFDTSASGSSTATTGTSTSTGTSTTASTTTGGTSGATTADDIDEDGDGYSSGDGDCDDANAAVHPDADELCNLDDDDCDDEIDEDAVDAPTWYADADGDGLGDDTTAATQCEAPDKEHTWVDIGGDCNDDDDLVTDTSGQVTFVSAGGIVSDLTDDFSAATKSSPLPWAFTEAGTLRLCPGTWFSSLSAISVTGAVAVEGHGGAEQQVVIDAAGSERVMYAQSVELTISGVTLTGGNADVAAASGTYIQVGRGGAVAADASVDLTLTDCIIAENTASNGAAVALASDSLTISGCTITGNTTTDGTGALHFWAGDVAISDTLIQGNDGGVLNVDWSGVVLSVSDSEIAGNTGTVLVVEMTEDRVVTLSDVAIHDNDAAVHMSRSSGDGTVTFTCDEKRADPRGVWGNGAGAYIEDGTLISESCDWNGDSDNKSYDVYAADAKAEFLFGDDASFSCTASGCESLAR